LAVIAAHDQLSGATGKGQGAWASHKRMALIAGTEYSRFSVSINRLLQLGYVDREPLATDRRKFTYRVVYTDDDGLPSSEQLLCLGANEPAEIVCSDSPLSNCPESKTPPQYISRREETYSVETGETYSPEGAHLAARISEEAGWALKNTRQKAGLSRKVKNLGAKLATVERALDAGDAIDHFAEWEAIGEAAFSGDHAESVTQWAIRLTERLLGAMTPDERQRLNEQYGMAA
jgi:hypothetical protein